MRSIPAGPSPVLVVRGWWPGGGGPGSLLVYTCRRLFAKAVPANLKKTMKSAQQCAQREIAIEYVIASCISAEKFGKPDEFVLNRIVDMVICASWMQRPVQTGQSGLDPGASEDARSPGVLTRFAVKGSASGSSRRCLGRADLDPGASEDARSPGVLTKVRGERSGCTEGHPAEYAYYLGCGAQGHASDDAALHVRARLAEGPDS